MLGNGVLDKEVSTNLDVTLRGATDRLIETSREEAPVEDRLRAVNRQASELRNSRLERAIRGWAAREPEAARIQDRVDRRRLSSLEELCVERMGPGDAARRLARVFQLVFVGAQHLDPPLGGEELYRTYRLLEPVGPVTTTMGRNDMQGALLVRWDGACLPPENLRESEYFDPGGFLQVVCIGAAAGRVPSRVDPIHSMRAG